MEKILCKSQITWHQWTPHGFNHSATHAALSVSELVGALTWDIAGAHMLVPSHNVPGKSLGVYMTLQTDTFCQSMG
jgi:hypothetical protein